jgi:hypothetical protein
MSLYSRFVNVHFQNNYTFFRVAKFILPVETILLGAIITSFSYELYLGIKESEKIKGGIIGFLTFTSVSVMRGIKG